MFDFRPQEGWNLAIAWFPEGTPDHITAQAVPVAGWLQDEEGRWRPAVADIHVEAEEVVLEFASEFIARQRQEHEPFVALMVPPGLDVNEAQAILRDAAAAQAEQ